MLLLCRIVRYSFPTRRSSDLLGVAGQLARRVAERLKLRQDVFLAELEIDAFYDAVKIAKNLRRYEPLPRFPSVERDFSVLLADGTKFSDVTKTIRSEERRVGKEWRC